MSYGVSNGKNKRDHRKKKGFGDYKKLAQKIESYALTPGELLTEYP